MSRKFSPRVIAELTEADGLDPVTTVDSQEWPALAAISGFKKDACATLVIAPGDADVAHVIGACCALVILSDEPISVRLAGGETLMSGVQEFLLRGKDSSQTVISGPLLFTGNGANEANVKVWAVSKV
jgi:hypothetical protein